MLGLLSRRSGQKKRSVSTPAPRVVVPPENAVGQLAFADLVFSLSGQASSLGQEAAEVRGTIDDTEKAAQGSIRAVRELGERVDELVASQSAIDAEMLASQQAVAEARTAVESVGGEVSGIIDALREVAQAARQITQIALQTRLVAFNASVEAKRAGDAGLGFGVVADAVRDLAGLVETSSQHIMGTVQALDTQVGALAREIQRRDGERIEDHPGAVHRALTGVDHKVGRIQAVTEDSRRACDALRQQMESIEAQMRQNARALNAALGRTDALLHISEDLIETVAETGVETPDTPFIQAAQKTAVQIAQRLEQAVASGAITEIDLFDEYYVPIAGTQPQQHMSRFSAIAERLFPPVQEAVLALSPKVVFCIAVDRNGYVPVHNTRYCQPQRQGDLAWNTANSRWRRIFNDRTGLSSARNARPFLLQTYRRDMGAGNFVVLKEVAAPIVVGGRHWGGVRLAFTF